MQGEGPFSVPALSGPLVKRNAMSNLLYLYSGSLLAEGADGGMFGGYAMLIPLVMVGLLFYFMMILPEKRKRTELTKLLDSLKKNDHVVTVGGIFGTVVNVQKESPYVTIKVDESNNTKLKVLRSSISRVVTGDETSEKKEST